MQKITPCLWFDDKAEEAARYYVSIFANSKIDEITHYGQGMPKPAGSVLTVTFTLDGQEFMALNAGPQFPFTEAISLTVNCQTQAELDTMWRKLSAGGQEVQCGWLKDKYGLSWQVVPVALRQMLQDANPRKAQAVLQAIMPMVKLDLAALKQAYDRA